jgi:hypothetical protein
VTNQVSVYGATAQEQAELDRLSMTLADLDFDSRMSCTVNGFVYATSSPVSVVSSMTQCMIAFAAVIGDDDIKRRVVGALRDAANIFEAAIAKQNATLN